MALSERSVKFLDKPSGRADYFDERRVLGRTDGTDYTDLFMIAVYSQCEDDYGPENGERIHGRLPPSVP